MYTHTYVHLQVRQAATHRLARVVVEVIVFAAVLVYVYIYIYVYT